METGISLDKCPIYGGCSKIKEGGSRNRYLSLKELCEGNMEGGLLYW
jgi:hypothetical protein